MLNSNRIAPLQVSKWIKIPMLIDLHEMEDLLLKGTLPFKIYNVQKVTKTDEGIYEPVEFLNQYGPYIDSLKKGEVPHAANYPLFSSAWSVSPESFVSVPTQDGRRLLKAISPIVQIQMNQIRYSPDENTFRTQVFGPDTISWGIQVGFPHLFLDPHTYEASNTRMFPNMSLFAAIQKWVRHNTIPTPFVINDTKINAPIRVGKKCFPWIHSHPQLQQHHIHIHHPIN